MRIERGRGFTLDDEKNHAPIAVLSYDYWTRSFARDPTIVGQTHLHQGNSRHRCRDYSARASRGSSRRRRPISGFRCRIVAEFNAWGQPAGFDTLYGSPKWWCLRMMARLRAGVSPAQAQQALTGTFAAVVKQTIGNVDPKEWKPLLDFVPARGIGGYNETLPHAGDNPDGTGGTGAADRVHQCGHDGAGPQHSPRA